VIVGSGPSAIFAELPLTINAEKDIAIFEKGKDIHERKRERGMELLCGSGGAGAFSDGNSHSQKKWGKLT
jgi:uncharacterized FAD-dependent dehydrogenase